MVLVASVAGDIYEDAYPPGYTSVVGASVADAAGGTDAEVSQLVPAAGTGHAAGGTHLRVFDKLGALAAVVPDFQQVQLQDERNQPGQLTASLPMSAAGVATLAAMPAALIGVYENGRQVKLFVYDEDDDDDADPAGDDRELSISAPGVLSLFGWVRVYPQDGFDTPAYRDFVHVTPGAVLVTLLQAGQARGTLDGVNGPPVSLSFDAEHDSDGREWPASVWLRYEADKSMLDVIGDLVAKGYIDVRMRGLTLDAFIASGTPQPETNVLPVALTRDAAGWTASAGAAGAVDASVLPPTGVATTAAFRLTGNAPPPPVDPADPLYGIVPFADAVAVTAPEPVTAGQEYVASVAGYADATGRQWLLAVRWHATNDGSVWLREDVLTSASDSPAGGWVTAAGRSTAPDGAAYASIRVTFEAVEHNEVHRLARPQLTGDAASTVQADLPTVVLHRTDWVTSAPAQTQRSPIETVKLGLGDGNISLELADPDAVATYGRREGVSSQSGVSTYGALAQIARLELDAAKRPKQGWTVSYVRGDDDPAVPQPWLDYGVGNWVRADWLRDPEPDGPLMPVRVSSVTTTLDTGGVAACSLELNDLFLDRDEELQRRAAGLLVSTSPTAPGGASPVVPGDTLAPVPVDAVFVGSDVLLNADGSYSGVANVTWPAVLRNTDGSVFDDLGWYTVQWRVGEFADPDTGWTGSQTTKGTGVTVPALQPGATFQARVLVEDFNGNAAASWTVSAPTALTTDPNPPPAPDAPTVTQLAGGVGVAWDGLDHAGAAQPPDYAQVEVHVSTVAAFTPSTLLAVPTTATLADTVGGEPTAAATTLTPPRLAYGTDYYVRLVAVDTAGNRSPAGDQAGPIRMRLIGPADLDPATLTNTDHSAMLPADIGWTGGSLVTDGAARDGEAMMVATGQTAHYAGYTGLKPGRYRATWLLRTDAVAPSSPAAIAQLNATGTGIVSDGARVATTTEANSGTGYRAVTVLFTVTAATNTLDLPVANTYGTNVWLSHAYVEPVQSIAVAEIRDAMVADLSATKLTAGTLTADVIAAMDANGKPGRIRVGVVNPATGLADQPGFSLGADGFRAQAAGGLQTLLIDTAGNVTVTGSITAGSTLPGSVYSSNLVANASMEDLPVGGAANVAGTVPAAWTDGYETTGPAQSAYADATGAIGGSQSLTVQSDDVNSGRGVASQGFAVVPGERLQVVVQVKQAGVALNPVFVRLLFGTSQGFARGATVAAVPAAPTSCVVLNLDGSVATQLTGSGGAGFADVMSGVLLPALGTAYKVVGSVIVPAGATWARLGLYQWARGGATAGTTRTTFDNTVVERAKDGHAITSATITGPTLRTAAGNVLRVEITGNPTSQSFVGPQVNFYQNSATAPPARIYTIDYTTVPGFMQAVPNVNLLAPAFAPYTWRSALSLTPNEAWLGVIDDPTGHWLAYTDYHTNVITTRIENAAQTVNTTIQQQTGSWVLTGSVGADLINAQDGTGPTVALAQATVTAGFQTGGSGVAGTGSGLKLDVASEVRCTVPALNTFAACKASSFPVSSTTDQKTDVDDIPAGYALDAVLYAPARSWRYETPGADYDGPTRGSGDRTMHVFPVLEDLPSEVWHDAESVDLRDVVGLLWQSVRELAGRVEQLAAAARG